MARPGLVYLEAWERQVVAAQDRDIAEVALEGIDTAARARVAWRLHAMPWGAVDPADPTKPGEIIGTWKARMDKVLADAPRMAAQLKQPNPADERPCSVTPDARYRGPENQLYRVEIQFRDDEPCFKWSRDNGSVVFAVDAVDDEGAVTLATLGRDDRFTLREGDWVDVEWGAGANSLLKRVASVDPVDRRVTFEGDPADLAAIPMDAGPILRRWDMTGDDGLVPVGKEPIDLEYNIQVWFDKDAGFRAGDYWLIPARTAGGNILGYGDAGAPEFRPSNLRRHYAPLALVPGDGAAARILDLRRRIKADLTEFFP
jgi:hypothetical protein